MQAFTHFTLILMSGLLFGAPFSSMDGGKEKVVSILLTPGDPNIAKQTAAHRKTLGDCGYDVIAVDGSDLTKIRQKLKQTKTQPGAVHLVDSHGMVFQDGAFFFMKQGAPGDSSRGPAETAALPAAKVESQMSNSADSWKEKYKEFLLFPGGKLTETIAESSESPRIWIDACYAGMCPVPKGCKAGMVCFSEQAFDSLKITDLVVKLLCSKKSDCKAWRQVDSDKNGTITPAELNTSLGARASSFETRGLMGSNLPKTDSKSIAAFSSECVSVGGKVATESIGYPFEIRNQTVQNGVQVQEITSLRESKSELDSVTLNTPGIRAAIRTGRPRDEKYSADYFATSLGEARRIARNKGYEELDVVQLSSEEHVSLTCNKDLPVIKGQKGEKQRPEVGRFDLEAPNCALQPNSSDRKSGDSNEGPHQ